MAAETIIKHRRDTAANWTSVNPVLASGEIGFETDTGKFKIGDGTSTWTTLTYATDGSKLTGTINASTATSATTATTASNVPASGVTGTTLASNVVNSSLTKVGPLSSGTVGIVHADASGNLTSSTIVNADVSATAAIDATKINGTALIVDDLLIKMFNYPTSNGTAQGTLAGYDTYPKAIISNSTPLTNQQMLITLFTPIKTVSGISQITSMQTANGLGYGWTSANKAMVLFSCSGTNNTTLTPIAQTWDQDWFLWANANHAPNTTSGSFSSATAANVGNYTVVTVTSPTQTYVAGQWVQISGTGAGATGFPFVGMVVGTPSSSQLIVQRKGLSLATGTINTSTSITANTFSTTSNASVATMSWSGTGGVANYSVAMTSPILPPPTPGQWVKITVGANSYEGYVAETSSATPSGSSFTVIGPNGATSGAPGGGTLTITDSYGRYVRPLFTSASAANNTWVKANLTLNAGTTYAIGFVDSVEGTGAVSGTGARLGYAGISSANQLTTPHTSLGINGIVTSNFPRSGTITGGTITASNPWARLT